MFCQVFENIFFIATSSFEVVRDKRQETSDKWGDAEPSSGQQENGKINVKKIS